ncbi:MAG TPA: CPBP family glutamic-type intramembrane protease [Actinophytocola sp.]|uniref:CPBP family glutamic-type intramembrane protease n=1 Tax=Actinophytocola sp. TaxID=1872138 RepID=UPI002E0B8255|nr:CPBP family glutamic-type intramembrane protease [Actinophytocola sp.]
MSTVLRVLVLVLVVIGYYWLGKTALFRGARWLAAHTKVGAARWDTGQRADVLELAVAGASHVVLVTILLTVSGIGPSILFTGVNRPELLLLGALLGIGQMALGSLLCRGIIEATLASQKKPVAAGRVRTRDEEDQGASLRSWLGRSRGGWIRHHLTTLKVVPLPAAIALTGIQVASEEVVFRGVAITWLRDAGPVVALTTSIVLFVVMQAFFMSSWQAAMFPLIGGVVMGVVHGLVFWAVPDLAPLIVAHVVFFFFAVL